MGIVGRVYAGGIWYGILITYDPQAAKRQASRTMAREAQEWKPTILQRHHQVPQEVWEDRGWIWLLCQD